MNITQILLNQIQQRPDSPAIYYQDSCLSFKDFGAQVSRTIAGMIRAGVKPKDVVAIQLEDPLDHWTASLAIAHLGAIIVSIPRSTPTLKWHRLTAATKCSWVISDKNINIGRSEWPKKRIAWPLISDLENNYRVLPAHNSREDPWTYVIGSGSTGQPKIIPITHQTQLQRATMAHAWLPYEQKDTLLSLVSMHFYAAKQRCLEAHAVGAAVFLGQPGRVDYEEDITDGRITVLYGTVFHVERIMSATAWKGKCRYEQLTALMLGGSVVSMQLRQQIRKQLSPNLYVLWGTNESHTATITQLDDIYTTKDTVGRPFSGVSIEVVDTKGNTVPATVDGLIRIKSPAVVDGYLDGSKATDQAFRDGWFYPGDIGHLTSTGQLIYRGRADRMMIVSGVNVYPVEVEECLLTHPNISDALVTPLSHKAIQDVPVALVAASHNATIDHKSVLGYVWERLGRHALHSLIIVNKIPRNEQGKVPQEAVSDIIRSQLESRSQYMQSADRQSCNDSIADALIFTFNFKMPGEIKISSLDPWINLLDRSLSAAVLTARHRYMATLEERWLRRVLSLTIGLLQALRFPVFKPIELLSCEIDNRRSNTFRATCRSIAALVVPHTVLEGAIRLAIIMSEWSQSACIDSIKDRHHFFSTIEAKMLRAFKGKKPKYWSAFEVLRVADRIGVPFLSLPGGVFQLGWGCNARYLHRSTTDNDSVIGMVWTRNKLLSAQVLKQAGLPAPRHIQVSSLDQAEKAAAIIGYPVVIKPLNLERGEGVSINVGIEQLERAFSYAQKASHSQGILVEKQVTGICYRVFIVADRMLYAVRRLPIGVYGDGISPVDALVQKQWQTEHSKPSWQRSKIGRLDQMAFEVLASQGMSSNSVPGKGRFVALRPIETTAWGGVDEDVTNSIHPDNISAAIAATRVIGLEVAGVDIISPDIEKPWHTNGAIINEVNYAPLLGGGDISRKHITEYLSIILKNMGRIPIYIYVGKDEALTQGKKRYEQLKSEGVGTVFVHAPSLATATNTIETAQPTVCIDLIVAALMRRDTQCLVIAVDSIKAIESIQARLGVSLEDFLIHA